MGPVPGIAAGLNGSNNWENANILMAIIFLRAANEWEWKRANEKTHDCCCVLSAKASHIEFCLSTFVIAVVRLSFLQRLFSFGCLFALQNIYIRMRFTYESSSQSSFFVSILFLGFCYNSSFLLAPEIVRMFMSVLSLKYTGYAVQSFILLFFKQIFIFFYFIAEWCSRRGSSTFFIEQDIIIMKKRWSNRRYNGICLLFLFSVSVAYCKSCRIRFSRSLHQTDILAQRSSSTWKTEFRGWIRFAHSISLNCLCFVLFCSVSLNFFLLCLNFKIIFPKNTFAVFCAVFGACMTSSSWSTCVCVCLQDSSS